MAEPNGPRILLVNPDSRVLGQLQSHLRFRYKLGLASSVGRGLEYLAEHADTAVVVSPMRMPTLDGIAFLTAARALRADARRILICDDDELAAAVTAIDAGELCHVALQPWNMTTLRVAIEFALDHHANEMRARSATRRTAIREVIAFDPLTGLASRQGLLEAIESCADREEGCPAALFFMQVASSPALEFATDPRAATPVLMELAQRLAELRPQALCIARCGPSSLAVLEASPDPAAESSLRRARELSEGLTFAVELGGTRALIGVTMGIVTMGMRQSAACNSNALVIMGNAELAEQSARAGRWATPVLFAKNIAEDQLEIHYQPVIDVKHGRLHSVEAMVRWNHPHYGPIAPATFDPLAKTTAPIAPFADWALKRVCAEAGAILDCGFPTIAINVSMEQLLGPGFLYSLYAALDEASLAPSILTMEIREDVAAYDLELVRAILSDVRRLGIRVTIDHFGTGGSSFAQLRRLPVGVVKTDASFVRDFNRGGEAMIATTLSMAAKLGLETIVDGVESHAMLERVRGIGATLVQGFLLAHAMPAAALADWCRRLVREWDACSSDSGP